MTQILKPTAISDAMIEAGRKNTFIVEGRIDVAAIYTAMESARDDPDELREALERIASGAKLGIQMFEERVKERKDRLTWWAVNVLQDNLAACEGTASTALSLGDVG